MRTLVRDGQVVTAEEVFDADVLIEDSRVASVARHSGSIPVDVVLDARDCFVLPGGVDAHAHLNFPLKDRTTSDDFRSGSVAAAFGGTTTVLCYVLPEKGEALAAALTRWAELAATQRPIVDYGFHMIVPALPHDLSAQLRSLISDGVSSFKLYMAYPNDLMVDDRVLFEVLTAAGHAGGMCCVHAENGHVIDVLVQRALAAQNTSPRWHARTRPVGAEAEACERALALAAMADAPIYLVHLSSDPAAAAVPRWRERGVDAYGETCPHYLVLDESAYERPDAANFVLTPPLRDRLHQEELWRRLGSDDLHVVATDHCPTCSAERAAGAKRDFSSIPNGGAGIEHRLVLLYSEGVRAGRLPLTRLVDVFATSPAKLFGIYPQKGTLAPGSDADLVVFDPNGKTNISARTHHMNVDFSLYEGWQLNGAVRAVLCGGEVIVENGEVVAEHQGRFLARTASGRIS